MRTDRARCSLDTRRGACDFEVLDSGPALETLATLPAEKTLELAFIDADKVSCPKYYEALVPRVAPNGLIVFDNVFHIGQVVDPNDASEEGRAIREVNDAVAADSCVEAVVLADGLTIRAQPPERDGPEEIPAARPYDCLVAKAIFMVIWFPI